ncbi:MAG: hypothetical protein U9Q71_00980 [Pseudomonadota bacterium]|nr:hypothetical protein [Pseudomonadota bacterium]
MNLEQTNARWHEVLEGRYFGFLERLTALELDRANEDFTRFRGLLTVHIDFEESTVETLPEVAELPEERHRLIAADHMILRRLLDKAAARLAAVGKSQQPRQLLVRNLNDFLRLANVLEHHDQRERQEFYPLLAARIGQRNCERLARGMEAAMRAVED